MSGGENGSDEFLKELEVRMMERFTAALANQKKKERFEEEKAPKVVGKGFQKSVEFNTKLKNLLEKAIHEESYIEPIKKAIEMLSGRNAELVLLDQDPSMFATKEKVEALKTSTTDATALRTITMTHAHNTPTHFNPEVPPPKLPAVAPSLFLNNIFSMGEPNAILSLTPSPPLLQEPEEDVLPTSFERQLQMFPSDFSVPPPHFPPMNAPPLFLNNIFSMGEPNAILSLTPSPPLLQEPQEDVLPTSFERQLQMFSSDFSVPPPHFPPMNDFPVPPLRPQKTNNVEKVKQWIPTAEVGKILGNRAAMKKQIEGQYNCVITVHTEVYSHFGMTSVEIMAQNKDQCLGAQNAILSLLQAYQEKPSSTSSLTDSGVNSPSSTMATDSPVTTPEKRSGPRTFHRSSFRDQPKVLLELTPRKVPPMNE